MSIEFSTLAYTKLMLHCAKYPHCAVSGVLLAKPSNSAVYVVDTIPLFHISIHLTPMLEIAMTQIDNLATNRGLVIAGYYIAHENSFNQSPEAGRQVVEKMSEYFPNACLVVVDNKNFSADSSFGEVPLIVSQLSDGKWRIKENVKVSAAARETAEKFLSIKEKLVDFDNHLDDIRLDWRNKEIEQLVDA